MQNKKETIIRVYLVYVAIVLLAVSVVGQIVRVQFVQGADLKEKAEEMTVAMKEIKAPRGNIYADNERKTSLALSVPRYKIYMDLVTVSESDFEEGISSLSDSLASVFEGKSASQWESDLREQRLNSNQYYLIKTKVRNEYLTRLREFPIFKLGKYKGGYIEIGENKRVKPYGLLANRTIGYVRDIEADEDLGVKADTIKVGLEGYFDEFLRGQDGEMLMKRIGGGVWKPMQSDFSKEPLPGKDLYSSIDVDLQDVAERALLTQLKEQDAWRGCAVLMEVETGFIKAIANLTKDTISGQYYESQNLAVGMSSEPGSTFKLASLMVALEDKKIEITDSVKIAHRYPFYDRSLRDDHAVPGKYTVQYAFEKSSNVISQIIYDAYRSDPQEFVDGLKRIGLDKKLGVDIKGEGKPYVKDANDSTFWGASHAWMAIGYEVMLTPLQTLALYNAVANKGKMVKPQFIREIRKGDEVVQSFDPVVLNEKVCSDQTLKDLQVMLEGVVERGTARNVRARGFKIAGKTGTAKIARSGSYKNSKYQASFCGYFPADSPKYSCIVVVQGPTRNIYGAVVSGTVFKEIADKVYASDIENSMDPHLVMPELKMPYSKHGSKQEIVEVMEKMNVPTIYGDVESEWVITRTKSDDVELQNRKVTPGQMPNVMGMGLSDALYLMESQGLTVKVKGSGIVKDQSVVPGMKIYKGQLVTIELI